MLDNFGKRIKVCRVLAELTTKEIVKYVNDHGGALSLPAYTRWEQGNVEPKKKTREVALICEMLNDRQVTVSVDWILEGTGSPPKIHWPGEISDAEMFIHCGEELEDKNGWELLQVNGSYGEPWVSIGDTLIIQRVNNIQELHSKLVLIRSVTGNEYIGVLNVKNARCFALKNNEPCEMHTDTISSSHLIKWIRKI